MGSYVVMGVSGCGKSTIGMALSARLGLSYIEGDALHPAQNIAKMAAGVALEDADRGPWLDRVGTAIAAQDPVVISCSALRRSYRARILAALSPAQARALTFIHLTGSPEVIAARMAGREGHFMPLSLLQSQFATLESPGPDERAIAVSIDQDSPAVVAAILSGIDALPIALR